MKDVIMIYDNLPIYKSALNLAVYIETIVQAFDRYHKYTVGQDLRVITKELLFDIYESNSVQNKNIELKKLISDCEKTKMLLHICKELKAFKSFKQFEHSTKLAVDVCKQGQAWAKSFGNMK